MINKVEITGVNTANLPMISNEEKKELLIKIKNGDGEAREKFISRKPKTSIKCNKKIWWKGRKPRHIPSFMKNEITIYIL